MGSPFLGEGLVLLLHGPSSVGKKSTAGKLGNPYSILTLLFRINVLTFMSPQHLSQEWPAFPCFKFLQVRRIK